MFTFGLIKSLTILSIFLCIYLISTTNPIYAAFALIALFLITAAIFLILNIKFLTFVIIILYAGAVSILFLFIIFTLNLKTQGARLESSLVSKAVTGLALIKIGSTLVTSSLTNATSATDSFFEIKNFNLLNKLSFEWNEIELVGNLLYSHYSLLFLVVSYILLLVMVGIVTISNSLNFTYNKK